MEIDSAVEGVLQAWELEDGVEVAVSGAVPVRSALRWLERVFNPGEVREAGYSLRDFAEYEDVGVVVDFLIAEGVEPCITPRECYRAVEKAPQPYAFAAGFLYPVKGRPFVQVEDVGGCEMDVSAFSTADFERDVPDEFDGVAYARRCVLDKVEERALLWRSVGSDEQRDTVAAGFEGLVRRHYGGWAEQLVVANYSNADGQVREENRVKIRRAERMIRKMRDTWSRTIRAQLKACGKTGGVPSCRASGGRESGGPCRCGWSGVKEVKHHAGVRDRLCTKTGWVR